MKVQKDLVLVLVQVLEQVLKQVLTFSLLVFLVVWAVEETNEKLKLLELFYFTLI